MNAKEEIHLSASLWSKWDAGQLDFATADRLAAHLETDCEVCENFLLEQPNEAQADLLDGEVDSLLSRLVPHAGEDDAVGYARVQRTLAWSRKRLIAGAFGFAAAAAGIVLFLSLPTAPTYRTKGIGTRPMVKAELDVLTLSPGTGARREPVPLAAGAQVKVGNVVLFRLRLADAACVQLFRRQNQQETALLDAPLCLSAGEHVVQQAGQPLGMPLRKAGPIEIRMTTGRDSIEASRAENAVGSQLLQVIVE